MSSQKLIPLILITLCTLALLVGFVNSIMNPDVKIASRNPLDNKIALIKLSGVIQESQDSGLFAETYSAENTKKNLEKALEDPTVKGIILKINSPGGTVAQSQELYNTVLKVRKTKPVFVSMGDVAASGGYYIASAADRIYACPGTLTGSIGVIFNAPDASVLLNNKLGIKSQVIKSGKYKDIGSPSRPMNADEKELLTGIIQNSYGQFLNAITKGRIERQDAYKTPKTNLTEQNLTTYSDGRIFTGEQAKTLGFVDEVGVLDDAYLAINKLISPHKKLPLVPYNKANSFSDLFMNMQESLAPKDLTKTMIPFSIEHSHKLLYIWE